ncbi:MAG: response regulator [Nannocystaceae bacterium]|nr:response regulator [Nannocystaceae bacterium]
MSEAAARRAPTNHVVVADPDAEVRARVVAGVRAVAGSLGVSLSVAEARDGTTALALMGERRPRLLLCEVLLEGISGLGLLRRIRSEWGATESEANRRVITLGRRQPLPQGATAVVFVTTMSRDSDRYWGLREGAFAYLGKPFTDETLQAAIRKALAASDGAA